MGTRLGSYRSITVGLASVAAGLLAAGGVACSDAREAPTAQRLPAHISAALNDRRIGAGLPPEYRLTGVEHNRLSLVTLRTMRREKVDMRDPVARCAAIRRILRAEAPRTAAAAGVPTRVAELHRVLDVALAGRPGCETVVPTGVPTAVPTEVPTAVPAAVPTAASLASIRTAAGATASTTADDSISISAEARAILDAFGAAVSSAGSYSQLQAAYATAAAAAQGMSEWDASAIYAAIAQSQGSEVLWAGAASAGQIELTGGAEEYQSILRARDFLGMSYSEWKAFIGIMGKDAIGCIAAVGFLKVLRADADVRLNIAACGIAAGATSVWATVQLYNE